METFFIIAMAIITLTVGILLLVAPKVLVKTGDVLNKSIVVDDLIFSRRLFFGLFLLGAGLLMINNSLQIF